MKATLRKKRRAQTNVQNFKAEVRAWAEKIGVRPTGMFVQAMSTKWASCSRNGRVCFSTDLLEEEPEFQTVVIVHELLHLQVPNHGKLFKSLMNAYVSGWEKIANGRVTRTCCHYEIGFGPRRKSRRVPV